MSEWKSINTIPTDGTIVMVWADGYEWPEIVFYAKYREEQASDVGEKGYWRHADELIAEVVDSACEEDWTHWMPLPRPPSE